MSSASTSRSKWAIEAWLVAVEAEVEPSEIRRWWNVKETPALDAIVEGSPSLRLGTTEVPLPENEHVRGPVGRILDLISLRGTIDDYVFPVIDDALINDLLACAGPQPQDPPFEVIAPDLIAGFLQEHLGAHLTYRDRPLYGSP